MIEGASSVLVPWSSFYVMMGSSAAALTGLMFIVITLVTGSERVRKSSDGISTFSTPTVFHFGAALLASAVLNAPWKHLGPPAWLLAAAGLAGIIFVVRIMFRTRTMTGYSADAEDWIWYTILPFAAYATLFSGAVALALLHAGAMFAVAAGVTSLVFIGIRNSWDVVTYIALHEI